MFGSTNPFEQSSTSPFGQTNSVFGQNNSSNNPFTPKPFGSTTPFGSQTGSSTGVFGAAQTPSPFGSSMPAFGSSSTPAFGSSSTSFGGLLTPISAFVGGQLGGITVVSYPAITEEDDGTSGQTAKLESISAMPAYKDKRLESCVAIAGADYCVIAADYTGDLTKISQLTEKSVMASSGFQADVKALQKVLSASHLIYRLQHDKPMSCRAMARVLSHTLFYNRFFPYSAFNVLGGLDSEGKGCVFTYSGDAVACEKVGNSSLGSGSTLKSRSPLLLPAKDAVTPLSETEAVDLAKTVFASAADRDIYTGDKVEIVVLNASGLRREYMDLRKD